VGLAAALLPQYVLAGDPPGEGADVPPPTALDAVVGEDFRFRETQHFIIAYDTSYDALRPLIGRLEGIYDAIHDFVDRAGLGRPAPEERLPVVLFDDFDEFAAYAQRVGVRGTMAGFYHHRTNIAAFCNTANHPELRRISAELDRARDRVQRVGGPGPASPAAIRQRQELRRTISALQAQRDAVAGLFNRFVIQHEAAHQVLFNIGVHVREADNPLWLVEGLACQFEVPQSGNEGLLKRVNHMRLADFRDALGITLAGRAVADDAFRQAVAEGRLLSLVDLIGRPDAFATGGGAAVYHYAEAWALVYYLHQEHPEAFVAYLRRAGARPGGEPATPNGALDAFRDAFGAPDAAFERRWVARIATLRLDLSEAGR
jgi:hypothetical protein